MKDLDPTSFIRANLPVMPVPDAPTLLLGDERDRHIGSFVGDLHSPLVG
jgi:hypothetical protein